MTRETSVGLALKEAVQTLSKKKQTEIISEHIYAKYEVFKRFKPLTVGIDKALVADLPQFEATLVLRALSNHCRRPRYIKALARGGKRFDLNNRAKGEVTAEEREIAQNHPCMKRDENAAKAPGETVSAGETATPGTPEAAADTPVARAQDD